MLEHQQKQNQIKDISNSTCFAFKNKSDRTTTATLTNTSFAQKDTQMSSNRMQGTSTSSPSSTISQQNQLIGQSTTTTLDQTSTNHQCQGCSQLIQDRYYLQVMDKAWHLNCLRCVDCKLSLDSQHTCFSKDGLIYCKEDYYKRFPRKCHNCYQTILPNELVMRARQFVFHLNCFKCLVCERQLNTGDEFGIGKDGIIYCRMHYFYQQTNSDHNESFDFNFANTKQEQDPFTRCMEQFSTPTNATNPVNNLNSNTNNYLYMCNLPPTPGISPPSINPNISTNLINASSPFNIQNSNLNINSVSPISLANNSNLDEQSAGSNQKGRPKKRKLNSDTGSSSNKKSSNKNNSKSNPNATSTKPANLNDVSKKDPIDINKGASPVLGACNNNSINNPISADSPDDYSKHFDSNLEDYFSDNDDEFLDTSSSNGNPGLGSSLTNGSGYYDSVSAVAAAAAAAQRQKRMRTSFKHHQLRVMKSYFELNHNPDAKDLKQLSQKTGLSKRVLQVWFQNARAKFRRGQTNPCGDGSDMQTGGSSTGLNTSNTGVSCTSTSSISSSASSTSSLDNNHHQIGNSHLQQNQQHNQLGLEMIDDNSSQSLSLEQIQTQSQQSSNSSSASSNEFSLNTNYTLMGSTNVYGQSYLNYPYQHVLNQNQHSVQQQQANTNDFGASNLIVDSLII